jgi:hypothetical protein
MGMAGGVGAINRAGGDNGAAGDGADEGRNQRTCQKCRDHGEPRAPG